MKTNRFACAYLRIRGAVFCVGLLAMIGVSFSVGANLAKRTAAPSPQSQMVVPNASFAGFMNAVR